MYIENPKKATRKEFKLDAVSLVTEQNYKITEAARSLGISANMLGRWLKEQESEGGSRISWQW